LKSCRYTADRVYRSEAAEIVEFDADLRNRDEQLVGERVENLDLGTLDVHLD